MGIREFCSETSGSHSALRCSRLSFVSSRLNPQFGVPSANAGSAKQFPMSPRGIIIIIGRGCGAVWNIKGHGVWIVVPPGLAPLIHLRRPSEGHRIVFSTDGRTQGFHGEAVVLTRGRWLAAAKSSPGVLCHHAQGSHVAELAGQKDLKEKCSVCKRSGDNPQCYTNAKCCRGAKSPFFKLSRSQSSHLRSSVIVSCKTGSLNKNYN